MTQFEIIGCPPIAPAFYLIKKSEFNGALGTLIRWEKKDDAGRPSSIERLKRTGEPRKFETEQDAQAFVKGAENAD